MLATHEGRAISGIFVALILFAMLFTVGAGYLIAANASNLGTDQANASRQNALLQDRQESMALAIGISGSELVVSAANTGGIPVSINSIYLLDSTGKMIVPPGLMTGSALTNLSASQWPLVLDVGATTKAISGCVVGKIGCNIGLTGYTYSSGSVLVTVVTGRGNTFSAPYPPPPLTTTTTVATTSQVFDTTTTSTAGVGGNALVVAMVATPTQVFSCAACVADAVTVYNFASTPVTGVSLNPGVPVASVTGTASLVGGSCGAPVPSSTIAAYSGSGNAPSILFTCVYNSQTGQVGGFASFSGYAQGTLSGVPISSAQGISNNIQIGGSANVITQGAFSANFFLFKTSSCVQPQGGNWASPCTTSPSPFPPATLGSLSSAGTINGGTNYYVAFYVQVTNNFNSSLALLQNTFIQLDSSHPLPSPGNETDFWLAGASTTYNSQGYYYPSYPPSGVPTLTANAGSTTTCAETGPAWTPSTNCIDVAPGQTVTLAFAACGWGSSNWDWAGYQFANGFDNNSGCVSPWPSFPSVGSANMVTAVLAFLWQGQTYTQDIQYQAVAVLPYTHPTSTAVSCSPSPGVVNSASTCTVTVTDLASISPITPSGVVTLSGTPAGGIFSNGGACTLSGSGPFATCTVTYTPSPGGEGAYTLTAAYPGDTFHLSSSAATSLTVTQRSTFLGVSCPSTTPSVATTCTFTATDISPAIALTPTGTVDTLSDGGAGGSFGAARCTLSSGACTVTYTPSAGSGGSRITISAKYEGDTNHLTSTGSGILTVTSTGKFVMVNGNSVVACLTVTVTNNQASATPANFQEMITVNSNTYKSYLASNLANVNWQDGNGHLLNSWLESGNGNTQTSTIYWVNLGSNTISGGGGTLAIYYCMYAPAVNALNNANTGEFPTATGTYGQYDDGANVFTYYDNFAGTTIGAQYTQVVPAGATVTQSNGVTATTTTSYYGGLILKTAYSTGTPLIWESDVTAVSGIASGLMAQAGNTQTSMGYTLNFWSGSAAFGTMQGGLSSSGDPSVQIATGIMGMSWTGSSQQYYIKNYVVTPGTASSQTLPASEYYSFGEYTQSTSSSISLQWLRLRLMPPSAVMPPVSFGSLSIFVPVNGNTVVSCIPVTLTNNQASATPANFQQMVTVDSNNYNSYLASNLANVNWQDGNGNILNSWLESGNVNTQTATVYWVNLGSNIISGGGGTLTIYYCMYGNAVKALNNANTGEFPTATGTYGQYDDGQNVFTDYWNFAGTTLPTGWSTSGSMTATVNNGVTLAATTTGQILGYGTHISTPFVYESYGEVTTGYTGGTSSTYNLMLSQTFGSYWDWSAVAYNGAYGLAYGAGANWVYSGPAASTNTFYLFGDAVSSSSATAYYNYHLLGSSGSGGASSLYLELWQDYTHTFTQWIRIRAYAPGGVMPSVSFGSLQAFAKVSGNSVTACVPVTLTNSQTSATPANFQQMVTINSNNYNSYLASNLANVNWQDGNGNILNSWLESGNVNTQTSTVYWVNLGSNTIAGSGGTITIYYCMYAPAVNALNNANTGEFPTATGTYGQYDDGQNVFTDYWNFAGTSVPSGLTVGSGVSGTDYTFNNGLKLLTNTARIQSTATFNQNFVLEGYNDFVSNAVNGWGFGLYSSSSAAYGLHPDQSPWGATYYYNNAYTEISSSGSTLPNYFIWQVVNNAGTITTNLDSPSYSAYFTATFSNSATGLPIMVGHRFDSSFQGQSMNDIFYWLRVRNLPPSNVMPSTSFGSLALGGLPVPFRGALAPSQAPLSPSSSSSSSSPSSSSVGSALASIHDGASLTSGIGQALGGATASVTASLSPGLRVGSLSAMLLSSGGWRLSPTDGRASGLGDAISGRESR